MPGPRHGPILHNGVEHHQQVEINSVERDGFLGQATETLQEFVFGMST